MSSDQNQNDGALDFGPTLKGLQAGLKVFGRYSLIRQLGRGGMGVVWLGQDEKLDGREVALKFLPEVVHGDPVAVSELKAETTQCLDLTHTNIVRIHDWVEDGNSSAISMEYVDLFQDLRIISFVILVPSNRCGREHSRSFGDQVFCRA